MPAFALPDHVFHGSIPDCLAQVLTAIALVPAATWYGQVLRPPSGEDRGIFTAGEWGRESWGAFHKAVEIWARGATNAVQARPEPRDRVLADHPGRGVLPPRRLRMRRILTIDGGGIKYVMPAAFFAAVEEGDRQTGHYFDLIAGTSTGGIIALGLGLGMPATALVRFYEELGPAVFGGSRLWRIVRRAGVSAYTSGPLRAALEEKFSDRRLGESRSRLVIPGESRDRRGLHPQDRSPSTL